MSMKAVGVDFTDTEGIVCSIHLRGPMRDEMVVHVGPGLKTIMKAIAGRTDSDSRTACMAIINTVAQALVDTVIEAGEEVKGILTAVLLQDCAEFVAAKGMMDRALLRPMEADEGEEKPLDT